TPPHGQTHPRPPRHLQQGRADRSRPPPHHPRSPRSKNPPHRNHPRQRLRRPQRAGIKIPPAKTHQSPLPPPRKRLQKLRPPLGPFPALILYIPAPSPTRPTSATQRN